jgi:hypothetical protein
VLTTPRARGFSFGARCLCLVSLHHVTPALMSGEFWALRPSARTPFLFRWSLPLGLPENPLF